MRDGDDRARVLLQVLFEPRDRLGVEVVRRLVQEKNVGLHQEQSAQSDAPLLAARKHFDGRVAGRAAQSVHRHLKARVQVPSVRGVQLLLHLALTREQLVHLVVRHLFAELGVDLVELFEERDGLRDGLFDDLADGLRLVEARLLFEVADGVAGRKYGLAGKTLVRARDDAEQGRFAGAVEADDADLRAVEV